MIKVPNNLLLKPKSGIFYEFSQNMENKYFNDLTIIYLYQNKILHPKDKYFILKLLSPDCKIKIDCNVYKFPKHNHEQFLLNIYKNKQNIINKYI